MMNDAKAIRQFVETLDELTDRKKGSLIRKLTEEYNEIKDMYPSVEEYVNDLKQPDGLDGFLGP
jgi:hypothetical protein